MSVLRLTLVPVASERDQGHGLHIVARESGSEADGGDRVVWIHRTGA